MFQFGFSFKISRAKFVPMNPQQPVARIFIMGNLEIAGVNIFFVSF